MDIADNSKEGKVKRNLVESSVMKIIIKDQSANMSTFKQFTSEVQGLEVPAAHNNTAQSKQLMLMCRRPNSDWRLAESLPRIDQFRLSNAGHY